MGFGTMPPGLPIGAAGPSAFTGCDSWGGGASDAETALAIMASATTAQTPHLPARVTDYSTFHISATPATVNTITSLQPASSGGSPPVSPSTRLKRITFQ